MQGNSGRAPTGRERPPGPPRRVLRLRLLSVVLGGALLAVAGLQPAAASAATVTAIEATLPVNATSNPGVHLSSVSCASTGNCTAVGSYFDTPLSVQGLLLTETAGTWTTGLQAPLPADAAPRAIVSLQSVSCASAGNCTAVGVYVDATNDGPGLLLTETAGVWATGVKAPLPANAAAVPEVTLISVSCASPGNCTAIGRYRDSTFHTQGLLLTQTAGVWTGAEAQLPAGTATDPLVALTSVSCASAGNCTAVGFYLDSAGNTQGLLLTETAGAWLTGVEAPLPANAGANAVLQSVACASAGNCTAVGTYGDTAGNVQGLLLTEASGVWGTGAEATPPANAFTDPVVQPAAVSCASAGNCTAVGGYYDTAVNTQGLLLTQTAGAWSTGVEATLPAGAATNPVVTLSSVSCPAAGNCTAVGDYIDSSNNEQALLLSETAGVWAPGVEVTLPANAATSQFASLLSVSCASPGNCAAVGAYTDTSPGEQGLLVATVAPTGPDFTDLIDDSLAVGPGGSLVTKARTARSQVQAGAISSACTTLAGYVKQVKAQSGKTIAPAIATDVIGDARSIATQLGCVGV